MDKDELNKKLANPKTNIDCIKGFEIIAESLVFKIYDIFGRNTLLSMLYQVGAAPGHKIANEIKEKYNKEELEVFEALEILIKELPEFFSIQIREIEVDDEKIRIIIENYCFLRDPIKHRKKLQPGKALCRIQKGYFEVALKSLIGTKIKSVEINFLESDDDKDICVEELIFYK